MKIKKSLIITTLTTILITVLLTVVLGWFTSKSSIPFVTINKGEINLVEKFTHDGVEFEDEIEFDDLTFIDFEKDVMNNTYGQLNNIACALTIELRVTLNSLPIKTMMEVEIENANFPLNPKGLFYVIMFQEDLVIIDPSPLNYINNYHSYIRGIELPNGDLITTLADPDDWRDAIDAHNTAMLENLKSVIATAGETIPIQIVFWGDYEKLDAADKAKLEYNTVFANRIKFDIALRFTSTQSGGSFV